ncbi:hypothetical protein ACL9RI_12185 [Janthinobacterium sp. Mn2066]|uniref:hypothetical protein n=1 Tax=Janthinobacterium sp. Mn2066 TaxID=3395264 RepID=UPI003BC42076
MDRLAEGQSGEKKQRRLSLKGAAVALILAMHGLGLYFLLLPARQLKQYTEVAFLTLMPVRPATPIAATQLPLPISPPRPSVRSPAFKTPPASVSPPAVNETITLPAVDELALTPAAPVVEDLRARARLSVAAIDKVMRKEVDKDTPWLAPAPLDSQSKFQKRVASAYRGGPVLTVEEYLTADGRPASRVRSAGGGSRCYAMAENPGAGADPFKTGGKVKQVPCPGS